MIIYQKDFITIYHDANRKMLHLEWHTFATSEGFREALLTAVEYAVVKKVECWIANTKNMKAIRQQDQQWTIDTFFPLFLRTGPQKLATVISDDIFNQMAVSNIIAKTTFPTNNFEHQYFSTYQAALDWIDNP
jgi:hypothetical protein